MQYIRHLLIGLCVLGVLITLFIFGTGGNLSQLATIIIASVFVLNIGYLVFINELSHPSRLINMVAGYFALAAVELKYRAESARMEEEKAEASLPDLARARSSRLEAAEEFLKYVANHGLQPQRKGSSPGVQQVRLTHARSSIGAEGPPPSRSVSSRPATAQAHNSSPAEAARALRSMSALPPAPQAGSPDAAEQLPPARSVSAHSTSIQARSPGAAEGSRASVSISALASPPQVRSSANQV